MNYSNYFGRRAVLRIDEAPLTGETASQSRTGKNREKRARIRRAAGGREAAKREGIRQHDPEPPLAAISSGGRECYNENFKSEVRD